MPDAVLLSIAISLGQTEDEEDMNENSNQPLTQAFHGPFHQSIMILYGFWLIIFSC